MIRAAIAAAIATPLLACRPAPAAAPVAAAPAPEAPAHAVEPVVSLLGEPLSPPPLPPEIRSKRRRELAAAQREYARDPSSVDAIVWLGRRTAYLGDYAGAIDIYTAGLREHPDDARLLRHRGHRYLTVRRFDEALVDLQAAAGAMLEHPDAIEEDGLPNEAGVPTSSLYTNVWYHLALAHYYLGDHARAAEAWEACRDAAPSDDMRVAAQYWLAVVALRTGEREEAVALGERLPEDLVLYENFAYARLLGLFAGVRTPDERVGPDATDLDRATYGYGIGVWHHGHGRADEARRWYETVIATPQWAAFGYIAAEVELAAGGRRSDD